jgi:hypothetical protein
MESRKAKRLLKAVREVLFGDWNPIPGAPKDEYDHFAPAIVRLLMDKADRIRIAEHIRRVAGPALAVPESQLVIESEKLAALESAAEGGAK